MFLFRCNNGEKSATPNQKTVRRNIPVKQWNGVQVYRRNEKQKAASAMKRIRPSFVFIAEQKSFGGCEHQFAKELHEQ